MLLLFPIHVVYVGCFVTVATVVTLLSFDAIFSVICMTVVLLSAIACWITPISIIFVVAAAGIDS